MGLVLLVGETEVLEKKKTFCKVVFIGQSKTPAFPNFRKK
jgi:hypothetical protein